MKSIKLVSILIAVGLLSSCASQMTQDEHEYCIWRTSLAGTAVGSIGGVGGALVGAAGGAAIGKFACGPVGAAPVMAEPKKEMMGPLDSDGDGVPDSHDWCAGTPAGVSVDEHGCALDSDGDGVADYLDQCPGTPAGVVVNEEGCPLSGEMLMTIENVNFDTNSASLSGASEATLDAAVRLLKQNAGVSVDIVGHTDSRGAADYNEQLSLRRAESVRDYLVANGVDASLLSVEGQGESSPVSSNDTPEGRRKNRRVELIAH